MNIVVYCSSRSELPSGCLPMAEALGKWIGENNHTLIYGGVDAGLMHSVAQAVSDAQGKIIGVVPEVFKHRADALCNSLIYTKNLSERKAKMIELGDIFVVLPGGIGTIDEWISTLSDIMVMERIDPLADRPIIVANLDGMYDATLTQLAQTNDSVFARGKRVDRSIAISDTIQLLDQLSISATVMAERSKNNNQTTPIA